MVFLPLFLVVLLGTPESACGSAENPAAAQVFPETVARSDRRAGGAGMLESRTLKLVNDHRRTLGLAPLVHDARIAAFARRHSEDMAEGRVPAGHEGFEARQRDISKVIPMRGIAENVGVNDYPRSDTARAVVSGWLESRGHRNNIEGRYDLTGVGIAQDARGVYYYTQIFVRRKR